MEQEEEMMKSWLEEHLQMLGLRIRCQKEKYITILLLQECPNTIFVPTKEVMPIYDAAA